MLDFGYYCHKNANLGIRIWFRLIDIARFLIKLISILWPLFQMELFRIITLFYSREISCKWVFDTANEFVLQSSYELKVFGLYHLQIHALPDRSIDKPYVGVLFHHHILFLIYAVNLASASLKFNSKGLIPIPLL